MSRLIDGDALYEKACDLEAQALDYAVKISNDEEKRDEWLRWSAILAERTAFKHDVYDAPTIEPERKTGTWIPQDHNRRNGYVTTTVYYYPKCSECGHSGSYDMNYCPHCGAYMGGDTE